MATIERTRLSPPSDQLLTGCAEIGRHLGISPYRVFVMANAGTLPAFKVGGRWQVRTRTLNAWLQRLEAAKLDESIEAVKRLEKIKRRNPYPVRRSPNRKQR